MVHEVFAFHPFGIVTFINSWKKYPLDQWLREQEIGRMQQANFKIPEFDNNTDELTKEICGGKWIKIDVPYQGLQYICEKCKAIMPSASHTVYHTNDESIIIMC